MRRKKVEWRLLRRITVLLERGVKAARIIAVATRDEEEVTTAIESTRVARAGYTGSRKRARGMRLTNIFHVSSFRVFFDCFRKTCFEFYDRRIFSFQQTFFPIKISEF